MISFAILRKMGSFNSGKMGSFAILRNGFFCNSQEDGFFFALLGKMGSFAILDGFFCNSGRWVLLQFSKIVT
jgi:hypothetical protein